MSVVDVYKTEILGENNKNAIDNEIQSFTNSNLLKFHELEDENKSHRFPSQGYFNFQ